MKKILFWIFSAALTVASTLSASAAAPKALRAGGTVQQVTQQAQSHAPVAQTRLVELPMRSATTSSAFARALNGAPAVSLTSKAQAAPLASNAQLPELFGVVAYNDAIGAKTAEPGYWKINNGNTEFQFEATVSSYGTVVVDDVLYSLIYENFMGLFVISEWHAYDVETGEEISNGEFSDFSCFTTSGFAIDPTSGTVYGIAFNAEGNGRDFATFNFSTEGISRASTICEMAGNWNSMAFDSHGQLYGISYDGVTNGDNFTCTTSELCKIDKATGAVTVIGNTGMIPQYLSSACIDPKTDKMYWNVCAADESGIIAEVNLATGVATKVCDLELNDEIFGIYVPAPAAAETAPAVPMNLQASFPEGSLSGTISFDAPTTLFNGTAATGALSYKLLIDGEVEAEGNTTFGATNVTIPVEVYLPASYKFVLTVSNSAGESPKAKLTTFIGQGAPEGPANVKLEYVDGNFNLSWDAVTTTSDGGYIDTEAVRYNVFDADGNKVADQIAVTSWSKAQEMPAEITSYVYSVQAINAGLVSPKVNSNAVTLGSINPPYSNTFDDASALNGWTILDENHDGKVWIINDGMARMAYNSSKAMDDWLICPPLALEGGKIYTITLDAAANSATYPERIEVKAGTEATAAGMTIELLPPTDLTNSKSELETYTMTLAAPVSGIYYVGIHGISDEDQFYLWVDNFTVGAPTKGTVPGKVTDVTVTPAADGSLSASLSFKTPTLNIVGGALNSLTLIEVKRGDEVIETFENPAIGAVLNVADNTIAESGDVVYTITASNADGAGAPYTTEPVWVGFQDPAAPTGFTVVETSNPGEVTLSWNAVTTDPAGLVYPAGTIQYAICTPVNGQWTIVDGAITYETTYTYQAVPAGEQALMQFGVASFYNYSGGKLAASDLMPIGTPYAGIEESFPNGTLTYDWMIAYTDKEGTCGIGSDGDLGIQSFDNDGGFAYIQAKYLDAKASLVSGKISLDGMTNPGISLYTWVIIGEDGEPDINELNLYAREFGTEDWTLLNAGNNIVHELGEANEWANLTASLSAYANKVIQVRIEGVTKQYVYTIVDAITVGDQFAHDLALTGIAAPTTVAAGSDYNVEVTVSNNGVQAASAYTVNLYADGELAESKECTELAPGARNTVSFARNMSEVASAAIVYTADVVYSLDENTGNNTSVEVAVAPKFSTLPVVENLAGAQVAEGVKLTWGEPNLEGGIAETKTEDFEQAVGFSTEVEGWTFIDEDGSAVGGFQGMDVPGITPGTTTASFFVWDQTNGVGNQTFDAHSGMKYLAALFRYDDGQTSDWAISPTLSGNTQTISFYARSYSDQYPEKVEVYFGNGTEVSDFPASNLVLTIYPVAKDWTLYEAQIPEGATHFAIHSCASSSFMLMLDDVTYEAGSTTTNLSIVGYNVYRNGEKLTEQPTAECEFVDANAPEGTNNYQVVVVYNRGISAPAAVSVETSGLDNITAGYSVRTADGCIIVAGAEGQNLVINGVAGTTLYAGTAEATTRVAVSTGVYLVKVGTTVTKVIVR